MAKPQSAIRHLQFDLPPAEWSAAERAAWRCAPKMTVAQWAEAHRDLKRSAIPGKWRNANAPCLVGLMNLPTHARVREVWLQKGAQVGGSEAVRSWIGYCAEQDPDPMMAILPDEKKGRRIISKTVIPLFTDTPCLQALMTGLARDLTKEAIELANGFSLVLGYSGSGSSLKSEPIRYIECDEIDEYQALTGKNGSAIDMARKRTDTYRNLARIYGLSTPTVQEAGIAKQVSECPIQLWCWVPCPHCGGYQRLTLDRLKWKTPEGVTDKLLVAAWIIEHQAAWFQCLHCDRPIDNAGKNWALARSLWAVESVGPHLRWVASAEGDLPPVTQSQQEGAAQNGAEHEADGDGGQAVVEEDAVHGAESIGQIDAQPAADVGQHGYVLTPGGQRCTPGDYTDEGWPAGDRVGCRLPGWYSLWVDLWKVAAEWVSAQGDIGALIDFYNQRAGQPFAAQVERPTSHIFHAKCVPAGDFKPAPAHVVPDWAMLLIATADVQATRMYWVIRAWGYGYRSQRVDHGQAFTWDELYKRCLATPYACADPKRPPVHVGLMGIDSGNKPQDEYRFALRDLPRIKVLKGNKPSRRPILISQQTYQDPQRPKTACHIYLHLLDVRHFKDRLASMVRAEMTAPNGPPIEQWALNGDDDDDYNQQMASEHKVLKRSGRKTPVEIWEPVVDGAANHYWDCEVYQLGMADVARVDLMPPPGPAEPPAAAPPRPSKPSGTGWQVKPLSMK